MSRSKEIVISSLLTTDDQIIIGGRFSKREYISFNVYRKPRGEEITLFIKGGGTQTYNLSKTTVDILRKMKELAVPGREGAAHPLTLSEHYWIKSQLFKPHEVNQPRPPIPDIFKY